MHGIWNRIGWDGYHDLHEACALLHDMPQSLCSSYGSVDGVANASWYPQKVLAENVCENGSCTIPHRYSQILSVGQHGSDQTLSRRHLRHVSLVAMNSVPQLNLPRLAQVPGCSNMKIGQIWTAERLRSGPECLWSGTPVGNGLSTDSRHGAPQLSASHWAPLGSDQLAPLVDGWKKGVMLSALFGMIVIHDVGYDFC